MLKLTIFSTSIYRVRLFKFNSMKLNIIQFIYIQRVNVWLFIIDIHLMGKMLEYTLFSMFHDRLLWTPFVFNLSCKCLSIYNL